MKNLSILSILVVLGACSTANNAGTAVDLTATARAAADIPTAVAAVELELIQSINATATVPTTGFMLNSATPTTPEALNFKAAVQGTTVVSKVYGPTAAAAALANGDYWFVYFEYTGTTVADITVTSAYVMNGAGVAADITPAVGNPQWNNNGTPTDFSAAVAISQTLTFATLTSRTYTDAAKAIVAGTRTSAIFGTAAAAANAANAVGTDMINLSANGNTFIADNATAAGDVLADLNVFLGVAPVTP